MNVSNCPRCGGHVRAESIGWKCDSCCGFIDMQGNFHEHVERPFMPPMTNADRIRAMSDEELAKWIRGRSCRHCCDMCMRSKNRTCASRDGNCITGIIDWLQQPAEGE